MSDRFRNATDGVLDFIGDVRNHLDGLAEIVAAPFLLDDRFVDAAGGEVVAPRQFGVGVALVVAEIEIGFRAVVGDVDFAVLVGAHRAGIDIQVRIELQQADLEPAALEQTSDGSGSQALTQR